MIFCNVSCSKNFYIGSMRKFANKIDENTFELLKKIAEGLEFESNEGIKELSPIDKLLEAVGGSSTLHFDSWAKEHAYYGVGAAHRKKWIANIVPAELLKRSLKKAVEAIMTLSEGEIFFKKFPQHINTPSYGDTWGRSANYFELNNRAIAKMDGQKCSEGILSAIKMLPAIPPSARSWANCIVLSQIFPNIYGDGFNKAPWEENSIYGIKLNAGYSGNVISYDITDKISPEEQFRAFNDLAHFRGIKTGFRTVISEDQLKIARPYSQDENFRWHNNEHVELFINEHVKLIKLGFEAVFVDSAKHIGGYDCANYTGVGRLPEYHQMQHILYEIRRRSGCNSVSFVGEKSSVDFERYKNMGLTAGTALVSADSFEEVRRWSDWFKYWREYAPGPEVSNDNDCGGRSYEQRLNRINSCLFGFQYASDKLPSFMQTEDIFPLRYDTNTHHLMMSNPSYSLDGSPESHWELLFTTDDGRHYNHCVAEIFAHALAL